MGKAVTQADSPCCKALVVAVRLAESLYLRDKEEIQRYQAIFHQLAKSALPPIDPAALPEAHARRDSLGLIQHILYTL